MDNRSLQNQLFSKNSEKTWTDKILARQDVDHLRDLVKKENLTRSELLEMLYMLSSVESKLHNYTDYERYIMIKFFIWIRELIKIAELLYDYEDNLKIRENSCSKCRGFIDTLKGHSKEQLKCNCKEPIIQLSINYNTKMLLKSNKNLIEHSAKFLVDLYLQISRTSLSINAKGFMEILNNKYEMIYNDPSNILKDNKTTKGVNQK